MGNTIAVDKLPTSLQDLLLINSKALAKLTIPDNLNTQAQHYLKIWKFADEDGQVQTEAVQLQQYDIPAFNCFSTQSYVVLLISKHPHQLVDGLLNHIPTKFRIIVQSLEVVQGSTLACPLYESATRKDSQFVSQLYHIRGSSVFPNISMTSLAYALQLQSKLEQGGQAFLKFLYSGGTFRNNKIQTLPSGLMVSPNSQHDDEVPFAEEFLEKYPILAHFYSHSKRNQHKYHLEMHVNSTKSRQQTYKSLFEVLDPLGSLQKSLFKVQMSEIKPREDAMNMSNFQNELDMSLARNNHVVVAPNRNNQPFAQITEINEDEHQQQQDNIMAYGKPSGGQDFMSQVIPGLFVSGQTCAYDYQTLKSNKITVIINCAADYCINRFPGAFTYYHYFVKDSAQENIQCLFHEVNDIIDQALSKSGRVLIHCVQGMSRSVALAIAYLIAKRKMTFDAAEKAVLAVRPHAAPNQGFIMQLINFHKRMYQPLDKIRAYAICSYQKEHPAKIVGKEIGQPYKDSRNVLDSRGIFIICTPQSTMIWRGSKCIDANAYVQRAQEYAKVLSKFENVSQNLVGPYKQGSQPASFWKLFGLASPPQERINHSINFYVPLKTGKYIPLGLKNPQVLVFKMGSSIPMTHMKLNERNLYLLVTQTEQNGCIMIWKGIDWEGEQMAEKKFVHGVVDTYLCNWDSHKVLMYTRDDDDYPEQFARIVDYT